MRFGVQTFTIRKSQKRNLTAAYLPLVKLGIKSFEVARIDFNAENARELAALTSSHGVQISAIQVKPKYVFGAREDIVEFCRITNCKRVIVSMLPFRCILGKEEHFYRFLSSLDEQYELYEREGITLGYHHHAWEYVKLRSGKRRMDELIEKTKRIKFVHDTYWSAKSGVDPCAEIERFGDRLLGVHLRDLNPTKKGMGVVCPDAAIGEGVIDFRSVIQALGGSGCQYFVIEQKTKDPYSDIEKSYGYLTSIAETE